MAIPDSLLPQQGAGYSAKWSLDRDAQLRTVLGASLEALLGSGIVAGGAVTPTVGFGAEVAAGTTFFTKGVSYTLTAARVLTAPHPSVTNYAWWSLARTAADQEEPTELDTWTLSVDYTETDVAPSADHYPLSHLVCGGSGITGVVEPPRKHVGVRRGNPVTFATCDQRGTLTGGALVLRFCCPQYVLWGDTLTSGLSRAVCMVAPTATAVFAIYQNVLGGARTQIGTVTFAAGSRSGVIDFTAPVILSPEHLLEIDAPAVADATLASIALTLAGEAL